MFQELLFTEKVLTDQILCEIGSGGTNFTKGLIKSIPIFPQKLLGRWKQNLILELQFLPFCFVSDISHIV
jgi:hypothetical protein